MKKNLVTSLVVVFTLLFVSTGVHAMHTAAHESGGVMSGMPECCSDSNLTACCEGIGAQECGECAACGIRYRFDIANPGIQYSGCGRNNVRARIALSVRVLANPSLRHLTPSRSPPAYL